MNESIINWSGCWEQREQRTICRWIICWCELKNSTVGAIGGYSGGGAFQLEKFVLFKTGRSYIDAECDLSEKLSPDEISLAEDCLDKAMSFHSQLDWIEADTLYLKKDCLIGLRREKDLLLGQSKSVGKELVSVFEKAGLISYPIS